MEHRQTNKTREMAACALFATLMAVCSQIQIPLPMVPINLALFGAYLAGAVLGPRLGAISMIVYGLMGAVGLPVFAGFSGGLGTLLGKTGGYILGYILTALLVGLLTRIWGRSVKALIPAMVLGCLACYLFGTIWFMAVTRLGLWQSFIYCVFPFLVGDVVKILLATAVVRRLEQPLARIGWNWC